MTTDGAVEVESGLEHDLVRWLDGRPDVVWLVAQPVRFHFVVTGRRRAVVHTPDLLSVDRTGEVTLWDARPARRQDDSFTLKSELTAEECRNVGWRHEVFEGLATPMRMSVLWLHGYRRPMSWHARWIEELRWLLRGKPLTVGEIRVRDDGSGELVAAMWHLMATGTIACDLSVPIRESSLLTWRSRQTAPGDDEQLAQDSVESLVPEMTGTDALVRIRLRQADR